MDEGAEDLPPEPDTRPRAVELICAECGEFVRVADPAVLIRALHLLNECSVRTILTQQD